MCVREKCGKGAGRRRGRGGGGGRGNVIDVDREREIDRERERERWRWMLNLYAAGCRGGVGVLEGCCLRKMGMSVCGQGRRGEGDSEIGWCV